MPVRLNSSGAGDGIRVGLQSLFNDQNQEGKSLANQLDILRNHFTQNLTNVSCKNILPVICLQNFPDKVERLVI